jgi:hypothetical protein
MSRGGRYFLDSVPLSEELHIRSAATSLVGVSVPQLPRARDFN